MATSISLWIDLVFTNGRKYKPVALKMKMPGPADYSEELQNPGFCFQDPELKQSRVVTTPLGMPRMVTGNFAAVCQFSKGNKSWAVRCFLREVKDQQQHYKTISEFLEKLQLFEFITFKYLRQGIKVKQKWYPIVKMGWVDGVSLNVYIERHLKKPKVLLNFADQFRLLVAKIRSHGIAHGDLQHGNIMVTQNGKIRLVDYDGMYVPSTKRRQCPELGHYHYQHPRRSGNDYDQNLDNFSSLVIYLSLLALSHDPGLWKDFHNGENLIFTKDDFKNPYRSYLFKKIGKSGTGSAQSLAQSLGRFCQISLSQVPNLEMVLGRGASSPSQPVRIVDPYWWRTHAGTPPLAQNKQQKWWQDPAAAPSLPHPRSSPRSRQSSGTKPPSPPQSPIGSTGPGLNAWWKQPGDRGPLVLSRPLKPRKDFSSKVKKIFFLGLFVILIFFGVFRLAFYIASKVAGYLAPPPATYSPGKSSQDKLPHRYCIDKHYRTIISASFDHESQARRI